MNPATPPAPPGPTIPRPSSRPTGGRRYHQRGKQGKIGFLGYDNCDIARDPKRSTPNRLGQPLQTFRQPSPVSGREKLSGLTIESDAQREASPNVRSKNRSTTPGSQSTRWIEWGQWPTLARRR